jgi:hypothetical protein
MAWSDEICTESVNSFICNGYLTQWILDFYIEFIWKELSEFVGGAYSSLLPVRASVPQGSVLGPFLYTLYTADVPQHPSTTFCSFADVMAVISTNETSHTAVINLQSQLDFLVQELGH